MVKTRPSSPIIGWLQYDAGMVTVKYPSRYPTEFPLKKMAGKSPKYKALILHQIDN